MLGADLYETVQADPGQTWEQRKARRTGASSPSIRSRCGCSTTPAEVFGYVSFWLFPERNYGHLDNSAVDAPCGARAGRRSCTCTCSTASASSDSATPTSTPASTTRTSPRARAYEAVGFDRSVPTVDLWRRL